MNYSQVIKVEKPLSKSRELKNQSSVNQEAEDNQNGHEALDETFNGDDYDVYSDTAARQQPHMEVQFMDIDRQRGGDGFAHDDLY